MLLPVKEESAMVVEAPKSEIQTVLEKVGSQD